jgi:hypothetical protein
MTRERLTVTKAELAERGIRVEYCDERFVRIYELGKEEFVMRRYGVTESGYAVFKFKEVAYTVTDLKATVKGKPALEIELEVEQSGVKRSLEIDFSKKSTKPVEATKTTASATTGVRHAKYAQIKTCIESDIPVYLVGEAGTGKNFTLQEIADDLGMDFYFTNSVQQEYKITGFIDAGGVYHETEFYKAFTKGGLFFLDEIDASIPEVLVLLNAAIANRYFEFPNGRVDAHPDFRVVAAGNTVGSGANDLYTGRLVLDSATLDRFVIIEFDYDKNIELSISGGNEPLVNFIRGLRRYSKENGVRATFSYRCIITVTKLEKAGLDLQDIMSIAIFKGLDKDTIKTFKTDLDRDGNTGKYFYALQNFQKSLAA